MAYVVVYLNLYKIEKYNKKVYREKLSKKSKTKIDLDLALTGKKKKANLLLLNKVIIRVPFKWR